MKIKNKIKNKIKAIDGELYYHNHNVAVLMIISFITGFGVGAAFLGICEWLIKRGII